MLFIPHIHISKRAHAAQSMHTELNCEFVDCINSEIPQEWLWKHGNMVSRHVLLYGVEQ